MQKANALKALLVLFAAAITAPAAWAFNGCHAADIVNDDDMVDEADLAALEECLGEASPRKDLDGNGTVGEEDIDLVEKFLGVDCSTWCPADFDGNGFVNRDDRTLLVAALGQDCNDPDECPFDLNEDEKVNTTDLWFLLASCGPCDSSPAPLPFLSSRRKGKPNPCAEGPVTPASVVN